MLGLYLIEFLAVVQHICRKLNTFLSCHFPLEAVIVTRLSDGWQATELRKRRVNLQKINCPRTDAGNVHHTVTWQTDSGFCTSIWSVNKNHLRAQRLINLEIPVLVRSLKLEVKQCWDRLVLGWETVPSVAWVLLLTLKSRLDLISRPILVVGSVLMQS